MKTLRSRTPQGRGGGGVGRPPRPPLGYGPAHRQTDRQGTTTVTLVAHACRGLITCALERAPRGATPFPTPRCARRNLSPTAICFCACAAVDGYGSEIGRQRRRVWILSTPLPLAVSGVTLTAVWEQKRLGNYHCVNVAS